jgi:hypothetical protein
MRPNSAYFDPHLTYRQSDYINSCPTGMQALKLIFEKNCGNKPKTWPHGPGDKIAQILVHNLSNITRWIDVQEACRAW